jgi:hypothetical protein
MLKKFRTKLNTAFYGMKEVTIRDPNGDMLCFGQPLQPE